MLRSRARTPAAAAAAAVSALLLAAPSGGCLFDPSAFPPTDSGGATDAGSAACENGADDDGDGLVDWPDDPGCDRPADMDESDEPDWACSDGVDNDGDGAIDFPADFGCTDPMDDDESEIPAAACENGLDDDGDGLADFPADPGCATPGDGDETDGPPPACSDGADNDGDALVDFPADPGCSAPSDGDETDGAAAACANGLDDDGDALVDFPADPGCTAAGDPNEADPAPDCGGVGFTGDLSFTGVAAGTTMGSSAFMGSCAGATAPEHVYTFDLPYAVDDLVIDTGGSLNSAIYVRSVCDDSGSELACNAFGMTPTLFLGSTAAGTYFLFVDGDSGASGPYTVSLDGTWPAFGECQPGHAWIVCPGGQSCSDPGSGVPICNEGACRDAFDNDGDAVADYPDDPGCSDPADTSEVDPVPAPACANSLDDDGDGAIDYPADLGCGAASENDETGCGWGFDAGLEGWTVANTSVTTGWVVSTAEFVSAPSSLHYGDPATMSYASGTSANSGTATSPMITLPAGSSEVTFFVWLDVEGLPAFDTLELQVLPSGTAIWDRNDFPQGAGGDTGGAFVPVSVDLSAFAGTTIQLRFEFDTIDAIFNDGGGVYVDRVSVDGTCP